GIKTYEHRDILKEGKVIENIVSCTNVTHGMHVRTRAITVIGDVNDQNFGLYLYPLLSDSSPLIVVAAIEALTSLGASRLSDNIMALLRNSPDETIRDACLRFFAKVQLPYKS